MAKRKQIHIGEKTFQYKKDVLAHFKRILQSYNFDEYLKGEDFEDVVNLIKTHQKADQKIGVGIKSIKVSKVRHGAKCFELVRNDNTSKIFSYVFTINGSPKPLTRFSRACRACVQEDLRSVKQDYFDCNSVKGKVKCQETGDLLTWEKLCVDHRQPNTFSVIIDRFSEIHDLDLKNIEYVTHPVSGEELADYELVEQFRSYHREKASLRIVKKGLNLGRSHQARTTRQKKDLKIYNGQK